MDTEFWPLRSIWRCHFRPGEKSLGSLCDRTRQSEKASSGIYRHRFDNEIVELKSIANVCVSVKCLSRYCTFNASFQPRLGGSLLQD
jgi:hypothetical protein